MTNPPTDGWLYESGIGENRAARLNNGHIVEADIERPGAVKAGMISHARITKMLPRRRAIAALEGGLGDVILMPVTDGITEGVNVTVEITRAAISERSRSKLPWGRPTKEEPKTAPSLLERISDSSVPVTHCQAHGPDYLGDAGWHELIEEARSGLVRFAGGTLDIAVTPAMTMIDVDGDLEPLALAVSAARAAAQAIRRLRLQGSIGIDFPDVGGKSARGEVADAFDAAMAADCERTSINGFGFMQIVTRRTGPSLPELLLAGRMMGHALELLRSGERLGGAGAITLHAHPAIIGKLKAREGLTSELARRSGRPVTLQVNSKIAIGGGYAASETE